MRNFTVAKVLAAVALISLANAGCGKKEPTPAELRLAKGDELFRKADYAGAAAEYDESLKADPTQDVKIWEKGAFSYLKSGNLDKAEGLLLKTLGDKASNEKKLERYKDLAGMYQQAGRLDKAEEYYGEVMKLDPKDDASLSWMAEIASIRGGARANKGPVKTDQLDLALARYDKVIAINPMAPAAYINQRIALARYIGYLGEQKQVAEADAADKKKKKDAASAAALQASAAKLQERMDELRVRLEATNKALGAANKAARAAK